MKGNIYIIRNKVNDKVYIGQTKQELSTRFLCHKAASKIEDTKFYRAIKKYGFENFYIELIEKIEVDKLDEREKYWIKYYNSYNNGYNSTLGGQGVTGIDYKEIYDLWLNGNSIIEISNITNHYRDAISRILKENFNVKDEDILKRSKEKSYVVDNDTLINLWNEGFTPNQIVKKYGGDLATTRNRLINFGISEDEMKKRIDNNQKNLSLAQLNNLWEEKLSISEIARKTGSNRSTIRKQLEELGYTDEDIEARRRLTCNNNKKAIVQLDLNDNFIACYSSAKEGEIATGASSSAIGACCNHKPKYKTAKGYKWLFLKEYEERLNKYGN